MKAEPDESTFPSIPVNKERFPLAITYENESGTVFKTIFLFSQKNPKNIYTCK